MIRRDRPAGQPGTVHGAWDYPAVIDELDDLWVWHDTSGATAVWVQSGSALADAFEPAADWTAHCTHTHRGYAWCDTESECDSLSREIERLYGP